MENKEDELPMSTLRMRYRSEPDVPVDTAVALLHLNDPNWDSASMESSSFMTRDSFDYDRKDPKQFDSSLDMGRLSKDYDSESQTDSRYHYRSTEAIGYEEDSPYAEVRAAVANTDDPSMPVSTFRMWFLGCLCVILIAGLNMFFSMRYPSVFVAGLVAQLITLPCGKFLEHVLPRTRFNTFGYVWSLNPGPFNVKEHTVITVMANVVANGVYAIEVVSSQRLFFGANWGFGYAIMLCLSSQIIGFAFAGCVRQFLVWPAAMIYPGALVNTALFSALHKNYGRKEKNHLSRERFFVIAMICSFVWYWFPGYLFTALSVFNWVCWIAPNNIVVNQLFGYSSGLGMGFFTFDWAMISYVGSPLVIPWWAQVNTFVAFVVMFWILSPILYYKNVFFSKFLPMSSSTPFDNTGAPYDIGLVLVNGTFNEAAYQAYSPVYISVTFVVDFMAAFASITAVLVHTWLWYRKDIMLQLRRSLRENKDVHCRLMLVYPEVPHWWYALVGLFAFVLGVVVIEVYDTKMPVWALVLSLVIAFIFLVPIGMIRAITNQTIALQILAELIVGYVLPGHPVAMMIFKSFCYVGMSQGLSFLADLKLGHYMKIPPRIMFLAQVVATILACFVVVLVQSWMFAHIPDLCDPHQKDHFICPGQKTFATSAILWGGIGPSRLFSKGGLYYPTVYFFLIGAILPIPCYFLARRYPLSMWRFVNIPAAFAGIAEIPPATGINYSSWFMFGAFFQFFMRRYHFRWWTRYNYILSAALDSGLAISLIVIYFTVQFPKGGFTLNWWGNTVWLNTADTLGLPFYSLAVNQTFGPSTWS